MSTHDTFIEYLTHEQQIALSWFADDYLRLSRAHPLDHAASCDAAVARLYESINLKTPPIVWCESPWQYVSMVAMLILLGGNEPHDRLRSRLEEELRDPLWCHLWRKLEKNERALATSSSGDGAGLDGAVGNAIGNHREFKDAVLGMDVTSSMTVQLARAVSRGESEFENRMAIQPKLKLRQTLVTDLRTRQPELSRRRLAVPLASFMHISPAARFAEQLTPDSKAAIERRLDGMKLEPRTRLFAQNNLLPGETATAIDALFQARNDFMPLLSLPELFPMHAFSLEHLFLEEGASRQAVLDWLNIKRSVLHIVAFERVCFMVNYPEEAHFDADLRLHSATSPALKFSDRYELYAWHGVFVPPQVITAPESLTCEAINTEPNVEVRRILVERFGLRRFIEESGAVAIDQDECGVLYKILQTRDEPIVVVKVINSTPEPDGSFKEYFLRVPPHIHTARAAVAWTFDMQKDDYQPSRQT